MIDGTAVSAIWISFFVVIGVAVSITMLAKARVAQTKALAGGEQADRYRELAAESAAAQQAAANEIAELSMRITSLETLLKEVA